MGIRHTIVFILGAAFVLSCSADTRVFNNSLVVGFYGHFFEIVKGAPTDKPCSIIINHINEGTVMDDGSVSIANEDILHSGQSCSTGEMVMKDTPSENPVPGIGQSDAIYTNLLSSTGFWVGKSTRTCGKWIVPDPTAVFMVYVENESIIGPYNVPFSKGSKYLLFTNDDYTCVYKQIAKPTPPPVVVPKDPIAPSPVPVDTDGVTTGIGSGDNETYSSEESFNEGDVIGVPVTVLPGEPEEIGESMEPSPEDDGSVCFPGNALVELDDGSIHTMASLSIGDRVRVGPNEFSEIFMFTHRLSDEIHKFVKINTASQEIMLTRGHYLYVNGALAAAKTVLVGDSVELASGDFEIVVDVSLVQAKGLYNPQTIDGDIIVNNIRASTYTTTVDPAVAHSFLAPLRALYNRLGFATIVFESGMEKGAALVPSGASIY